MTNKELITKMSALSLFKIYKSRDGFDYTRLPDMASYIQDYLDAGWSIVAIWEGGLNQGRLEL